MSSACTPSPLLGLTTTRSAHRRRRGRFVTFAAAPKKAGSKASSARLARILRQYDQLEQQQEELANYAGREPRRAGQDFVESPGDQKQELCYRWDPEQKRERPVRGGLGHGKLCWWALWVKENREKQVVEQIERLVLDLPPLVDEETGEEVARVIKGWAPNKKVKAWNPKTNKMGMKTLKYDSGGVVLLRCVLDDHLDELLAGNINVLGFRQTETIMSREGKEGLFPQPFSEEMVESVRQWERDLTPLDEDAVRKMLGLPAKELADTMKAVAEELEQQEQRESKRRDTIIKRRDWFEGGGEELDSSQLESTRDGSRGSSSSVGAAFRQQAQEQGAGAGAGGDVWGDWWGEGSGGSGASGAGGGSEAWGGRERGGDDPNAPPSDGQLRALERLGHSGPLPATRSEASALLTQLKDAERGSRDEGPPSEGQLTYLSTLGYKGDPPATRAAASELIDELKSSRGQGGSSSGRLDPEAPPSEGQMRYLQVLGHRGDRPATRAEADELIDALKAEEQGGSMRSRGSERGRRDDSDPPSTGQLDLLQQLDYAGEQPATRAEASRLIDELKASRPRRSGERDGRDEQEPPTSGQLHYLKVLGHAGPPPTSRFEARQLIDSIKVEVASKGPGSFATPKPDPQAPPSEGQRRYLTLLGHEGELPATRAEADELIDQLKQEQQASGGGIFDPERPASAGQIKYLELLGEADVADRGLTRGEADTLIERLKKEKLGGPDPQRPPSEGQLRYLQVLRHRGPPPATRAEADTLIDSLKSRQGQRDWDRDWDRSGGYSSGGERGGRPDPSAPPSEGQLRFLESLGHEGAVPATRAEAGELIAQLKAEQRAAGGGGFGGFGGAAPDPQGPPSEGQLKFLASLQHSGAEPATRAEADELIRRLKAQQDAMPPEARPVTDGQLRFLETLGHQGPAPTNRGEANALIEQLRGSQPGPDPQGPPSQGQLEYLGHLGHLGDPPTSRAEAGELIDRLKREAKEQAWRGRYGSGGAGSTGRGAGAFGSGGWYMGGSSEEEDEDALSYFGIDLPSSGGGSSGSQQGSAGWGAFDWGSGGSGSGSGAAGGAGGAAGGEDVWGSWQEPSAGADAGWQQQQQQQQQQAWGSGSMGSRDGRWAERGERAPRRGERAPRGTRDEWGSRDSRGGGDRGGWFAGGGGADATSAGDADLSWWDVDESSPDSSASSQSSSPAGSGPQVTSYPLDDLADDSFSAGDDSSADAPPASGGRSGRKPRGEGGLSWSERSSSPAAAATEGLSAGTEIAVTSGAFADFAGRVLSVEGQRVRAELDIFGRPTVVDLDPHDLKPQ